MADNAQKTPITRSLPDFVRGLVRKALRQLPQSLPCSVVAINGQTVTVQFQVSGNIPTLPRVTMPIATSIYDWLPVTEGDVGVAQAANAYLGGVSGLGGGVASLTQPPNLATGVFQPVGNAAWTVPNPAQRVVQSPAGVLLRTSDGAVSIDITESGVVITGTLTINGLIFGTHIHDAPSGGGDTGGPIAP